MTKPEFLRTAALIILALLGLLPTIASADAPLFRASFLSCPTGASPRTVQVADLNSDGRADLVVTNSAESSVSVFLQGPDGTLAPRSDLGAGSLPFSVAIGDVNGDHVPDLVAADHGVATLSVLPGNGDGTFGALRVSATGGPASCVALADMNRDGRLDAVVATTAGLAVMLGNGDGTFRPDTSRALPGDGQSLAVGDVNGDGKPDVALASGSGWHTVSVLLGDGSGKLTDEREYAVGPTPRSIAIADVNGDRSPDLVVACFGVYGPCDGFQARLDPSFVSCDTVGTISVLLGQGDGTFGAAREFPTGNHIPGSLAVADVNHDGSLDVVVADPNTYEGGLDPLDVSNTVTVLLGEGSGVFFDFTPFAAGGAPQSVAIGDLNGDGLADVVAVNSGTNSVSVLPGDGAGRFGGSTDYLTGSGPTNVAIADLDHDLHADLAVTNQVPSTVSVLLGAPAGTQGVRADYDVGFETLPAAVAIADLNGDGLGDLAVAKAGLSGGVSVLLGAGDGTWRGPTDYATGLASRGVAAADLNGDGKADVVVANGGAYPNYVGTVTILLGNGDGTLSVRNEYPAGSQSRSVAVADLNADGAPDLVVANTFSNTVSVLLGVGDGTFAPKVDYVTGELPYAAAIADLNRDGKPDLVVANSGAATLSLLMGVGDGTFAAASAIPTASYPRSVAAADLDGDGAPDLAIADYYGGEIRVLRGNGDGTFRDAAGYGVCGYPESVAIGDVDGDGRPDLVAAWDLNESHPSPAGVSVLVNTGGLPSTLGDTPPRQTSLALSPPTPNPVRDHLTLRFTLPSAEAAQLRVFDIAGRSLAAREVGSLGVGAHVLTLPEAARWRPGIYLVRLTQGARSQVTRACVAR